METYRSNLNMDRYLMAIKRFVDATNDDGFTGGTQIPQQAQSHSSPAQKPIKTGDEREVQSQYQHEAESKQIDKINTGTMLPKDLTVKLVRADTSNWETFLSCLYSFTLTLFGLFLGTLISRDSSQLSNPSTLEIIATIVFGCLSLLLIGIWVCVKIRVQIGGVRMPHDVLDSLIGNKG